MKYSVLVCIAASLMANAVAVAPASAQSKPAARNTVLLESEVLQHCSAQVQSAYTLKVEDLKRTIAGYQRQNQPDKVEQYQRYLATLEKEGLSSFNSTLNGSINNSTSAEVAKQLKEHAVIIRELKRDPGSDLIHRIIGVRYNAANVPVVIASWEQRHCMYELRDRKLKGLALGSPVSTPVTAAAPAPSTASNTAAKPGARSLGQQDISACSDEIRRLQLESQSWTGNVNDNAARLGRMQKDLFEGRCAGHPEAAAYIAGANRMLGYQTAAGGSAQSGASSNPGQARTGAASQQHNPAHAASHCIKVYGPAEMKALGMHGVLASKMVNSCHFSVSVTWCIASSATRRGDCNPGYGNLVNLSGVGEKGSNTYGVDAVDQTVHFGACRYGKDMGFIPVELDRQNPFRFACK